MDKQQMTRQNNWIKENKDTLRFTVPKGTKDPLYTYWKEQGYKSFNDYVVSLIQKDLENALTSVDESAKIHADIALENIRK